MIETSEQALFSIQQLEKLRQRAQVIEADSKKDILLKEMELSGIRGTIEQIEKELRFYNLVSLRETLKDLQTRSQKASPEELPLFFTQMLGAMDKFTKAMQSVI